MWITIFILAICCLAIIIDSRRRIRSYKMYNDFTKELTPINATVRYLHPTNRERAISELSAKIFITKNGLIVMPLKESFYWPDIFLFVNYKVYEDNFPKPVYLGLIIDYRITKNVVIIISEVKKYLNRNAAFEFIIEAESENMDSFKECFENKN